MCLKSLSDMYIQFKQLSKPVLLQDSSSSTISIRRELVSENGCKWSRDVHNMRINPSKLCDVLRELRGMYKGMMECSVIRDDYENNKESAITSSSPSITPYPEATSPAVLSVNDEANDSWKHNNGRRR